MMTKTLLALTGASLALGVVATPAHAAPNDKPLVYIFVLDGLDGDLYDQGRLPGIKGLVDKRGTYYQESRAIMVAETNPNHTAMITGAYADTSGIPGNDFALYGNGATSVDGCPLDGVSNGPVSVGLAPECVQAQTFFQSTATKSTRDKVTSAGIFGKPKLATLFAAKRSKKKYAADYLWTPCQSTKTDYCRKTPLNVWGYADDKHTMDAVLASVREGVKSENGKRKKANLTIVNLPTIDSTGHSYGAGKKYRKAAADTDAQIDRFVRQQRKLKLWSRTVLFLVSDHSMDTTPDKITLRDVLIAAGIPAESFIVVQNGGTDMVYLTDRTSPDRFDLLHRMRQAALAAADRGIDEALYREPNPTDGDAANTLDGVHPAWHLNGERTGDLVVTHATGGAFSDPINPTNGGHGGPFTTDNFFAITGGWKGLVKNGTVSGVADARFDDTQANPGQAENVDVAPTALRVLGLEPPRDNRGRALTEAFKGW
ncbi:MAG: alkaline phosphatase family protein [Candidatus Nanopelagicales bacterium]|nr:alkaline phosphatase family protein [Candidatus Nanopelagicales bacterium]